MKKNRQKKEKKVKFPPSQPSTVFYSRHEKKSPTFCFSRVSHFSPKHKKKTFSCFSLGGKKRCAWHLGGTLPPFVAIVFILIFFLVFSTLWTRSRAARSLKWGRYITELAPAICNPSPPHNLPVEHDACVPFRLPPFAAFQRLSLFACCWMASGAIKHITRSKTSSNWVCGGVSWCKQRKSIRSNYSTHQQFLFMLSHPARCRETCSHSTVKCFSTAHPTTSPPVERVEDKERRNSCYREN